MASVCSQRGPHCISSSTLALPSGSALLAASVLSLRGPAVTRQPIVSSSAVFTLAWNGQMYALQPFQGPHPQHYEEARQSLEDGHNDGMILARWIESTVQEYLVDGTSASEGQHQARRRVFQRVLPLILDSQVEGEWAFTLVDHQTGDVYFGRDALGRRSLLVSDATTSGSIDILLASAAAPEALSAGLRFTEVDCAGFWIWSSTTPEERPRMFGSRASQRVLLRELRKSQKPIAGSDQYAVPSQAERDQALDALHATLLTSVARRVAAIGGQVAQDLSLTSSSRSDYNKPSPVAILFSGGLDSALLAWYTHLALPAQQSIDLLNVAFENPRVLQAAKNGREAERKGVGKDHLSLTEGASSSLSRFSTPDRLLSHATLAQLQALSPGRQWNLVEIDVTYEEYQSAREDILAHMHPCESVMDLSLGSVLWFASRGWGSLMKDGEREEYKTAARVYISGLGADELCGGYSRHRKAFEGRGTTSTPASMQKAPSTGNWAALIEELQMDLDRLPTRNLGRDDRILSSHGREGRYPFLSSDVVSLIASLPLRIKCELGLEQGVGDKILLRQLARRAGLKSVSAEKKRAMQFGARSAKMEVGQGRIKGHMKSGEGKQEVPGPSKAVGPPVPDAAKGATAPVEVFTTLCYYLDAPRPDKFFPVDDFQLPTALQVASSKQERKTVTTAISRRLFEHVPLLQAHVDRLISSRHAMRETFPTTWGEGQEEHAATLTSRILTALEEALQRFDDSLGPNMVPASNDEERHRRRVRLALNSQGHINVVVAKMAPWLPPRGVGSAPLPTVRLDMQSSGPSSSSTLHSTLSRQQRQQLCAPYLYKTSSRSFYDAARERVGATLGLPPAEGNADPCFEVLMWTTTTSGREASGSALDGGKVRRLLTESSIANILVQVNEGEGAEATGGSSRWLTPRLAPITPVSASPSKGDVCFLPGLMRSYLLQRGLVEEADLTVEDLIRDVQRGRVRIWLCNALRGVMQVRLELGGEEAGETK
ncbi:hypothetical protein BCV69DRAFT_281816 [Microstroma glucosiphilum]|uniref:Asparagine synthetase domain-containing protein n=1 Tax=Pseudomicrostroma glucosiphilum TaxID=1684307 RepID=A0A316U9S8_9BASI|nr:hypothetical protein BCV69DRAFT_281816 [Pseudomicrostroma glucosiphilum]PWN21909.1 hypothetical protein BCV69DRAFT_281816 [Pseudomicrostroma glucosiphilum]